MGAGINRHSYQRENYCKFAVKECGFGCCTRSELQDTFVLLISADYSEEINAFVEISTILDQNYKLSSGDFRSTQSGS